MTAVVFIGNKVVDYFFLCGYPVFIARFTEEFAFHPRFGTFFKKQMTSLFGCWILCSVLLVIKYFFV